MPEQRPNPISRGRLAAALAAIALLALIFALAGGGEDQRARAAAPARAGSGEGGVALQQIGEFESPTYVAAAPGFRRLLFVVELPGTIRVLRDGRVLPRPFLDISDEVAFEGERGLFSVAFDPDYRKNRRFYVYYTDNEGDLKIDAFKRRRKEPTRAGSGSRNLLEIAHPFYGNHNGGQLQFGPDGDLWIATGDGGGDQWNNARELDTMLGKILRIDPGGGGRGYSVPQSNPYVGRDGVDEIYAYGLRNPYRFSFDPQTGLLALADVGAGQEEEVNLLTPEGARGLNFGWPQFEGAVPFDLSLAGPDPATPPAFSYARSGGNCAVTGGYIVHDPALPTLLDRYVYSDLCGGQLRSLIPGVHSASDDKALGVAVQQPTSFGVDSRGHVYVTSFDGPVFRLVPG